MPKLDPFAAQIATLVRNMPDEALLDLVRNRLNVHSSPSASSVTSSSVIRQVGKVARRHRSTSADRVALLLTIEKLVHATPGLSSSEIASKTRIATPRVQSVLRELKHARRIFQGGDRRFARYAGDAQTAKQASAAAAQSAAGPRRGKR